MKYTYTGDADLNGRIDADDFFRLDQGFLTGATIYRDGDFNYSGQIDSDDFAQIDLAFLRQSTILSPARPAFATELIQPEDKDLWL